MDVPPLWRGRMGRQVTEQPTRDQLRALANAATEGPWEVHGSLIGIGRAKPDFGQTWGLRWRQDIEFICAARTAVPQLLDQLDAAEQRIRDLTQESRDERAACLDQMEQVRIRDARIKAVRELHVPDSPLDEYPDCAECTIHGYCEDDAPVEWPCPTIRALDGA